VERRIFTKENLNNSVLYQVLTLIKSGRMGWSTCSMCNKTAIFIHFIWKTQIGETTWEA